MNYKLLSQQLKMKNKNYQEYYNKRNKKHHNGKIKQMNNKKILKNQKNLKYKFNKFKLVLNGK